MVTLFVTLLEYFFSNFELTKNTEKLIDIFLCGFVNRLFFFLNPKLYVDHLHVGFD